MRSKPHACYSPQDNSFSWKQMNASLQWKSKCIQTWKTILSCFSTLLWICFLTDTQHWLVSQSHKKKNFRRDDQEMNPNYWCEVTSIRLWRCTTSSAGGHVHSLKGSSYFKCNKQDNRSKIFLMDHFDAAYIVNTYYASIQHKLTNKTQPLPTFYLDSGHVERVTDWWLMVDD